MPRSPGELRDESPVLVVFDRSRIDVSVGDENVALSVPRDVGRASELVLSIQHRTVGGVGLGGAGHSLRPAAEHHHDPPGGVELDDHIGPFVDNPDVVFPIDADLMGELDSVESDAPLLDEVAVRIELEQAGISAAVVHEDVPFRIGRDADALAEIQIGRKLEEIRHGGVRNDWNVFRRRLGLGN